MLGRTDTPRKGGSNEGRRFQAKQSKEVYVLGGPNFLRIASHFFRDLLPQGCGEPLCDLVPFGMHEVQLYEMFARFRSKFELTLDNFVLLVGVAPFRC
jgi:hypothetical protein